MSVQRTFSILSLLGASVLSFHCGTSTRDGSPSDATVDAGSDSHSTNDCLHPGDCLDQCTGELYLPTCVNGSWSCGEPIDCGPCGPQPLGLDCMNPCTLELHGPECLDGSWTCVDPGPNECPDSGTGCAPDGNAVPVSCDPFPENTACDPFGVWSLTYQTEYPGSCKQPPIDSVSIERGSDGIVRVAFGSTASATLSLDGCELSVDSVDNWTNPSENGTVSHSLTLSFGSDGGNDASGQLVYSETGLCNGSGTTNATATRITN
jgi:hypothetical protein